MGKMEMASKKRENQNEMKGLAYRESERKGGYLMQD
jgi:hypothetical protein